MPFSLHAQEDYVIGTCVLDDGKRSIGVVFRDPVERELYRLSSTAPFHFVLLLMISNYIAPILCVRVSMTVDTSRKKYSTVRIQFHKVGLMFRLRHSINKSKVLNPLKKWLKKKNNKKKGSRVFEHKIRIPVELCQDVSKARSLFNTSSMCSDDGACQLFLDESWSGLNPITSCTPGTPTTLGSFEDEGDLASTFCFNPVSKISFEMIEEINSLRKSF